MYEYLRIVLDPKKAFLMRFYLEYAYKDHEKGSSNVCWLQGQWLEMILFYVFFKNFDRRGCGEPKASNTDTSSSLPRPQPTVIRQAQKSLVAFETGFLWSNWFPKSWVESLFWDHLVTYNPNVHGAADIQYINITNNPMNGVLLGL